MLEGPFKTFAKGHLVQNHGGSKSRGPAQFFK